MAHYLRQEFLVCHDGQKFSSSVRLSLVKLFWTGNKCQGIGNNSQLRLNNVFHCVRTSQQPFAGRVSEEGERAREVHVSKMIVSLDKHDTFRSGH